jgi:1-acyl-sn-glycerol-3-phosphate acyltransferase
MSLADVLSTCIKISKRVVGSTAAYGLLTPAWIGKWCGRIKVHGCLPSQQQMSDGGVLIIANHPSLIETIVLPALLSPWRWNTTDTKLPYSVADSQLFGRHSQWLYEYFRCIPVYRTTLNSTSKNWQTTRTCLRIFTRKGILIVYPEGGRTCKGQSWYYSKKRMVRTCNPTLVKIAQRTEATIIPVWISHGNCTKPRSLLYGYYKLFFKEKMVVTFGNPVTFPSSEITNLEVANVLLHTVATTNP